MFRPMGIITCANRTRVRSYTIIKTKMCLKKEKKKKEQKKKKKKRKRKEKKKEKDKQIKKKRSFFQAAVVSILLYGCTTWTLTKRLEKKLDGNYTRMLRAILNKSWRQHLTKHQLYGHLPQITKTIQARRIRHAGHCWRSRDELISDVLLWTPTYGRAKARQPARTYIQQLCEDTGCKPEVLPEAMNDRESGERGSGIFVLAAGHDDDDDSCLWSFGI